MKPLTGTDIRKKDFEPKWFGRGYKRAQVDTYLGDLARSVDHRDDEHAALLEALAAGSATASTAPTAPATATPIFEAPVLDEQVLEHAAPAREPELDDHIGQSYAVLEQARRVAEASLDAAKRQANEIVAQAEVDATALHRRVREAQENRLAEARDSAETLLRQARQQADSIVADAQEREHVASRREAEVELQIAHQTQLLTERAHALRVEAQQLNKVASVLTGSHAEDDRLLPGTKADRRGNEPTHVVSVPDRPYDDEADGGDSVVAFPAS